MNPKERILAQARKQFFANGYTKVLMAEIAKELGMSKKTLYQYFASKDELVLEVIKVYQQEMQHTVEQLINDQSLAFPDKASQIFKYVATQLHGINPSFIEDIRLNSPKSWLLIQQYKADAAYFRFNALLADGMRNGYIKNNINRSLAVMLYASAIDTIVNPSYIRQVPQQLTNELPFSPDAIFDGLVKIIFNGILVNAEV